MLDLGLEMFIDRNAPAVVCLKTGGGQVEIIDGSLAADGVEQRVAGDTFLALKICDHGGVGQLFDALNLFAQAKRYAGVAQVIAKSLDDFAVCKFKQAIATVR